MKGVCGCANLSKLKQLLPEFQSRLFENQEAHFILHYSFFIIKRLDHSARRRIFLQSQTD
jgi:hypothetical protein